MKVIDTKVAARASRARRLLSKLLVTAVAGSVATVIQAPPAPAEGFGPAAKWHDRFAIGTELPAIGDVNRDGRDDLISFVQGSSGGELHADVWVSLSEGVRYGPATKWHDYFAPPGETPLVGDVDGDGDADIVSFIKSGRTDEFRHDVWVALSDGARFGLAQQWHTDFGADAQVPLIGDFDGDGDDDIGMAVRSTYGPGGPYEGDVYVALSSRTRFGPALLWHSFFAPGEQQPAVGDVDGDGDDDLISFIGSSRTGEAEGDVLVARSNRAGFDVATKWHDWFAPGAQVPKVGDVDGDGVDDIVTFLRSSETGQAEGDVWVAFGQRGGTQFTGGRLWHDRAVVGLEVPLLGDADGDRKDDVHSFLRETQPEPRRGDVLVYLSGDPSPVTPRGTLAQFGHGTMRIYAQPALGNRPLMTVFVNFSDARVRAATDRPQSYFEDLLFTGVPNLAQHYREMSGGRFSWVNAGFYTVDYPDDLATAVNESTAMCAYAVNCPGTSSNEYTLRAKVVRDLLASRVNFATFDTDRDGTVYPHELEFLLIDGQNGGSGANRPGDPGCAVPRGQTVQVCLGAIAGVSQNTDYQTMAHEVAHSLGASDLYSSGNNGMGLTLMSATGSRQALHLDPWHKIQLGWVEPRMYSLLESGSCARLVAAHWGGPTHASERNPVLLFDPYRPGEYFLLEFRSSNDYGSDPTRPDGWTSDGDVQGNGLAVWQVKADGSRLAGIPGLHLEPGPNGRLESVRGGDDQLDDSGTWIVDGGNRIFESTVLGDDRRMMDHHNFPFGNRRAARTFTSADGVVPVTYADGSWSPLVVKAGVPNELSGSLYVKWSMHSFRGQRDSARLSPSLADCYRRVP